MTDRPPTLLPPYTGQAAECPKCGWDQPQADAMSLPGPAIRTIYCRKMEPVPPPPQDPPFGLPQSLVQLEEQRRRDQHPPMPEHPVIAQIRPGQEALVRECQRCGYPWPEATIDDPDIALARLEERYPHDRP